MASTKDHLKTIERPDSFSTDKIPKLVDLIHGFWADADSWPKDMAKNLTGLRDPGLYVLTVDWKKGADITQNWELGSGRAAANTSAIR